jgi:endogenous inhibitor of DNA gyrase (YacG/DUF329 family)
MDEPEQTTPRHCETCLTPLPTTNPRRRFCSPPCKAEGWRREHRHDSDHTVITRKHTAAPPAPTLRDCPHCGQPIAIVTLLATPHVARPDTPTTTR